MYFVVFKCTRDERGDVYPYYTKDGDKFDSYYIKNRMYSTREEAKEYANSIAHSRQPRVVKCVDFMCPGDGHWQEVR